MNFTSLFPQILPLFLASRASDVYKRNLQLSRILTGTPQDEHERGAAVNVLHLGYLSNFEVGEEVPLLPIVNPRVVS